MGLHGTARLVNCGGCGGCRREHEKCRQLEQSHPHRRRQKKNSTAPIAGGSVLINKPDGVIMVCIFTVDVRPFFLGAVW